MVFVFTGYTGLVKRSHLPQMTVDLSVAVGLRSLVSQSGLGHDPSHRRYSSRCGLRSRRHLAPRWGLRWNFGDAPVFFYALLPVPTWFHQISTGITRFALKLSDRHDL